MGYYDGVNEENTRIVAENYLLPNGITKSPNGRYKTLNFQLSNHQTIQ